MPDRYFSVRYTDESLQIHGKPYEYHEHATLEEALDEEPDGFIAVKMKPDQTMIAAIYGEGSDVFLKLPHSVPLQRRLTVMARTCLAYMDYVS